MIRNQKKGSSKKERKKKEAAGVARTKAGKANRSSLVAKALLDMTKGIGQPKSVKTDKGGKRRI